MTLLMALQAALLWMKWMKTQGPTGQQRGRDLCTNVPSHVPGDPERFFLPSVSLTTDPALPTTLLKFCRQVAEGLSYLAGKSFVHRDIAARNILLDQELNCKVSILIIIGEVMHGCITNHTLKYIKLYFCLASLTKLFGFGMTRDLNEEDYYTVKAGRWLHIKWTAPEVLFYKKYSTSSDVWSYGMLMY